MTEPAPTDRLAETDDAITVNVVIQISPMWRADRPGEVWHGDLPLYAEQMTGYLVRNLERFTDPRGADLLVVVSAVRGDEHAGHEFRSGHYVLADDGQPVASHGQASRADDSREG